MIAVLSVGLLGCGRIIAQKATEQLIAGDAVDRTIAQIDFRILTGKKVYLDSQFVNKAIPGVGFVTSEYIISSIRQKMMCDGCLLHEKIDDADFVVEMRIGALGADGQEVIYGMPSNNYLSLAASVAQTPPAAAAAMPSMPEISFAKKADQMAAAKIALFAYNRRSREPIWQSGLSESRSSVDDRWYLGAGPFHKGNIYTQKKHAQPEPTLFGSSSEEDDPKPDYFVERRFTDPSKSLVDSSPAAKPAAAAIAPPAASAPAAAPAVVVAAPVAAVANVAAAAPAVAVPAAKPAVPAVAPAAATPAPAASANSAAATPPAAPAAPPKTMTSTSSGSPTNGTTSNGTPTSGTTSAAASPAPATQVVSAAGS